MDNAISWRVLYKDGTIEEGYDNLSKEAYNNTDVIYFSLFINNCRYSVDLTDGVISLNHVDINSSFSNATYRLVFYRVCEQTISTFGSEPEYYTMPYFGWQTTINNKNYKHIYGIAYDNRIVLKVD